MIYSKSHCHLRNFGAKECDCMLHSMQNELIEMDISMRNSGVFLQDSNILNRLFVSNIQIMCYSGFARIKFEDKLF
jgi:hypothetical protein